MYFSLFENPRCVFIRIRKTGTTSIVKGLLGNAGDRLVVETVPESWRDAFCFAFVRNPFDRLVSAYDMFRDYKVANAGEEQLRAGLTLDRIMDVIEDDAIAIDNRTFLGKLKLHAIPMTHPNYDVGRANFIGRFETFGADYLRLARELGLDVDTVAHHRARENSLDYRGFYTPETAARARRLLAEDCETFQYTF